MLAEARGLTAFGFHLFPVARGGKVPAIPGSRGGRGHLDATIDQSQIDRWLEDYPEANAGIACGPSGLVVLDIDPRNGGRESFEELLRAYGDGWLNTPTSGTPAGGFHVYLGAGPLSLRSTGSSKPLLPGIDVKAENGYVVCPPSRRRDGVYRWQPGRGPSDVPVAPAPQWLVDRLDALHGRRELSAQQPLLGDDLELLYEGNRNNHLASLAGTMRRRGMSAASIEAALLADNAERCRPPLPDQDVRKIAASIGKYPPGPVVSVTPATQLLSHSSLFSHSDHAEWPESPALTAFAGLAGEVVDAIIPYTEADPVALLANLLIAFGNVVGSGPHVRVGAGVHTAREFMTLVGRTSKARKGDSWHPVAALFEYVDRTWLGKVASGLSSGEGLIYHVRDQTTKKEPIKEKGRLVGYQDVIADEGVDDKRLLVFEPEFARVLRMTERSGNSVSATIRQAWDTGTLQTLTKNSPLRATGAHISIMGHITIEELLHELPDIEAANGFANRIIWLAVKRSGLLPDPEPFHGSEVAKLGSRLGFVMERAQRSGQLHRDDAANDLWHDIYGDLSAERPGLSGALLARAEAHVLRLSMLYALLDGSPEIREVHLVAAVEFWAYAERSVEFIFGDATGNPVADAILRALQAQGRLTRTEISALFGRHETAGRINNGLQQLLQSGKAAMVTEGTGGRPVEVWRPVA
jgi:hypothetical protein